MSPAMKSSSCLECQGASVTPTGRPFPDDVEVCSTCGPKLTCANHPERVTVTGAKAAGWSSRDEPKGDRPLGELIHGRPLWVTRVPSYCPECTQVELARIAEIHRPILDAMNLLTFGNKLREEVMALLGEDVVYVAEGRLYALYGYDHIPWYAKTWGNRPKHEVFCPEWWKAPVYDGFIVSADEINEDEDEEDDA